MDEDTSATNFMVRDAKMRALIHPKDEPITPFIDRVRELFDLFDVSTLLVMGGSGDYFEVADAIIEMKQYLPHDVTARAREIAGDGRMDRESDRRDRLQRPKDRVPDPKSFDARRGRRGVRITTRGCESIVYGTTEIDLRGVEQIFDKGPSEATQLMLQIHQSGKGIAGVYVLEVAETKVARVHKLAEERGFPLRAGAEQE